MVIIALLIIVATLFGLGFCIGLLYFVFWVIASVANDNDYGVSKNADDTGR
jgi:phage shock protein PspC (stress-responsive transcriptional regulator)